MASIYNLKRNSRVFFTTNLDSFNKVNLAGHTTGTTYELSVLDGFSFTQTTTAQAITLNEAGSSPTRGQRSFNTALNPVDFSFSTYIRPNIVSGVDADEGVLWNALFGLTATSDAGISLTYTGALTPTYAATSGQLILSAATSITATGLAVNDVVTIAGVTGTNSNQFNTAVKINAITATSITATYIAAPAGTVPVAAGWVSGTVKFHKKSWVKNNADATDIAGVTASYAEVTAARSNSNTLLAFGLVVIVDGISYTIDNCVLEQASIDFGLDGIATVAWTGKGMLLNQQATAGTADTSANPVFGGGITGTATGKSASASTKYITNKLSTVALATQIGGGGTAYTVALTGGNIQITNNTNFLTTANLGVVNQPIGYFTGTRSITGTLNAYLRTGTTETAGMLATMLSNISSSTEYKYQLKLNIGGAPTAATRVEALINGASLQVPTVDASQDVISTAIQFTAQGTDAVVGASANYDVGATNDIRIRYFAA